MIACIIFQKGIVLSPWGDWSTCSTSCGGGEMIRLRSCLTGCESSTDDSKQTQVCNDQECPAPVVLVLSTHKSSNTPMLVNFESKSRLRTVRPTDAVVTR